VNIFQGLPLFDSTSVKIQQYMGCAAEFIKKAMEEGQKCLVNCQMGVSRSCTSAMAYLMIYENLGAAEILRTFRKRRDVR
jgi:protein-tyrosine phosphatase